MFMTAGITLKAYSISLFKSGVIGLKMLILTREQVFVIYFLSSFDFFHISPPD